MGIEQNEVLVNNHDLFQKQLYGLGRGAATLEKKLRFLISVKPEKFKLLYESEDSLFLKTGNLIIN